MPNNHQLSSPIAAEAIPPLFICAAIGVLSELYFISIFGLSVVQKVYFWPGFFLTVFWVHCYYRRQHRPWHKWMWRFAVGWSACWLLLTLASVVTFPAVFFFVTPDTFFFGWLRETRVGAFSAFSVHAVIWACSRELLKNHRQSFAPLAV
jgi:hypothetical protein